MYEYIKYATILNFGLKKNSYVKNNLCILDTYIFLHKLMYLRFY